MELTDWQKIDPETGAVFPWYTHSALEEIRRWDFAGKSVLEWGGGASTVWFLARGASVDVVETNPQWVSWLQEHASAARIHFRNPEDLTRAEYVAIPETCPRPDYVFIDGIWRTECIAAALALPRPLRVLVDNWQQDAVYVDSDAVTMMAPYSGCVYVQEGYAARNPGRSPWATAIWQLG